MRRKFWIYQRQNCINPWAMCIEKEWRKRKPRDALLTILIFSEDIDNDLHCLAMYDLRYNTASEYVTAICGKLETFTEVNENDREYLFNSIGDILNEDSTYNRR